MEGEVWDSEGFLGDKLLLGDKRSCGQNKVRKAWKQNKTRVGCFGDELEQI